MEPVGRARSGSVTHLSQDGIAPPLTRSASMKSVRGANRLIEEEPLDLWIPTSGKISHLKPPSSSPMSPRSRTCLLETNYTFCQKESRLGSGGSARVYNVYSSAHKKKTYALLVLTSGDGLLSTTSAQLDMLIQSTCVKTQAIFTAASTALKKHAPQVQLVGAIKKGDDQARCVVMMEKLHKIDYTQLSWDERLILCQNLMEIFTLLEKHSLLHRDLKPDNLMRMGDGTVVLIDWENAILRTDFKIQDLRSLRSLRDEKAPCTSLYCPPWYIDWLMNFRKTLNARNATDAELDGFLAEYQVKETEKERVSAALTLFDILFGSLLILSDESKGKERRDLKPNIPKVLTHLKGAHNQIPAPLYQWIMPRLDPSFSVPPTTCSHNGLDKRSRSGSKASLPT